MENQGNKFVEVLKKGLLLFVQWLKNIGYDFITSFKYNNMKLPALLIAAPGIFLGFFLAFHAPVINEVAYDYYQPKTPIVYVLDGEKGQDGSTVTIGSIEIDGQTYTNVVCNYTPKTSDNQKGDSYVAAKIPAGLDSFRVDVFSDEIGLVYRISGDNYDSSEVGKIVSENGKTTINIQVLKTLLAFDYTGIVIFVLMLFGILNIFTALSVSGKKNLGSVVTATISTGVIVVAGVLYIVAIFIAYQGRVDGLIVRDTEWVWDINKIMSLFSVIFSMATSVAGCVLGFIFYDRTYEKETR